MDVVAYFVEGASYANEMFMILTTGVLNEISIGPIQDGNKQIRKIDRNRIMRSMNAPKCSPLKCFVSVKYIFKIGIDYRGRH